MSATRRRSPLAILFAAVALDLVGFGMVVPMLPLYAQSFGASGQQMAWLLAAYSLMQLVFAPLWGRLSDRVGRRPVLLGSIATNVVCLVLFGLAPSYGWLLVARLGAGIGAANIAVAGAYVADVTDAAGRARGMGLIGAAFGLGFVVGPFVGGELGSLGVSYPALVAAALGLLNFVAALWLLPESRPPAAAAAAAAPAEGLWAARLRALGAADGALRLPLALSFVQVLGFTMLELALTLFARAALGYAPRDSGRLLGGMGLVLVAVQGGLIGRLVRRLGEARLATVGLTLLALGMAAVPPLGSRGGWPLFAALGVVACGQGLTTPTLTSLLSRRAPAAAQGVTLGLGQAVASLARVVGPQLGGVALDAGGVAAPFFVGGGLLALAALTAAVALRPPP